MKTSVALPILPMLLSALLAACALRPPTIESVQLRKEAPLSVDDLKAGQWPMADWWKQYQDPTLDALIAQALQGAPSLSTANARFSSARESVRVTGAAEGVHVDANASMQRQRLSDNGLFPPKLLGFNWYNQSDLGISASYTFDWWGKQHANIAAATDEAHATQAERSAAALVLASSISDNYFGWQADQSRLALAQERLSVTEHQGAIATLRINADIDSADNEQLSKQKLAATRADIAALQGSARLHLVAIAALLGKSASDLPPLSARALPSIAAMLPDNVRLDLIARRPDIAASRWRVEAARQNLVVARSDYFPDITIHALAGLSSVELSNLFEYGSRVPAIGVAIHLPLYDAGLRAARFGSRQAMVTAAVASYDQTVVDAAHQVAIAAANAVQIAAQREQLEVQFQTTDTLQKSAAARVSAGITDLRPQLNADLSVLGARDALVQLNLAAITADIALQRALGGGYQFKEASIKEDPTKEDQK